MPTNREKRPRWLMICKCGATVKASARKHEITPFGAVRALRGGERGGRCNRNRPGPSVVRTVSGIRNDRGAFEGGDNPARRRIPIVAALEQHPPFESARAHDGKTGQDPFPHRPV